MKKLLDILQKKGIGPRKLWRFASVSLITLPTTQLLLYLFYRIWDFPVVWANLIAVSGAAIPGFYLYKIWVWEKTGRPHLIKEILPFWITMLAGLALSTLAVWIVGIFTSNALAIGAGNIAGFGVVWVFKFVIFDQYLFNAKDENRAA